MSYSINMKANTVKCNVLTINMEKFKYMIIKVQIEGETERERETIFFSLV